ncbi:predicted protein [Thalassiosira pseudonana CCMP1335]|uniref:IPT/TIG domain-containing protein n=1 Tax=Thalassiosira pseudonana TaxID=35128 RepID=B8CCA9_THAPS|nr:predicted protein [Thalassiosira pseudonana CCMP1335]EED88737.1 predicted protein [Thalassiosira pseudonana CCMP1335]
MQLLLPLLTFLLPLAKGFTIQSIHPKQGSTAGESTVVVKGEGFNHLLRYQCLFGVGKKQVKAENVTATGVECSTPFVSHPKQSSLWICVEDGDCVEGGIFAFIHPLNLFEEEEEENTITANNDVKLVINNPHLDHLEPSIIIVPGRNEIIVKGHNFADGNLTCFYDQRPAEGLYITPTQIMCRFPSKQMMAGMRKVRVANDGVFSEELPFAMLEIIGVPTIARLDPSFGLHGSKVSVVGKSFHSKMKCQVNARHTLPTHFVNSSMIECALPMSHYSDSVTIALVLNEVPVTEEHLYTFVNLGVTSISPSFGETPGGTPVTLQMNETVIPLVSHCKFGDAVVSASIVQSELVCVSPAMTTVGQHRIGVSINEEDFVTSPFTFEYHHPATFSGINPTSGTESGSSITIYGSNFVNNNKLSCYFDDNIQVAVRWISNEQLVCNAPRLMPGIYDLHLSLNGVDVITNSHSFLVRPQMTTVFATPSFGTTAGNTTIQVYGTNFRWEDNLSCRFGNTTVVSAMYVGTNMVKCPTPPWKTPEAVKLVVLSDGGDESVVDSDFVFYEPFQLTAIHPRNGFVRGGTGVTVSGEHFAQDLGSVQCGFGGTLVDATLYSDREITCNTPPTSISGEVEVTLVYGSDVFALPSQSFLYDEKIILRRLSKSVVSSVSEQIVTVYGSHFRHTKELVCSLNPYRVMLEASFVSTSEVSCKVPKNMKAGEYDLSLSNNGQDFVDSSLDIRVLDPFKVHYIQPQMGSPDTVSSISLIGRWFEDFEHMACLLAGRYVVASNFVNSTMIQCNLPFGMNSDTVTISLLIGGVKVSNEHLFTFVDLRVAFIIPPFGDTSGGTPVSLEVVDETSPLVSHCKFGDEIVPARIDQLALVCISPPATEAGPVRVGLSVDGKDFAMSRHTFDYYLPANFVSINPTSGPESGSFVKIHGENIVNSNRISCYFDDTQVPGRWLSAEQLVCETPRSKPGVYELSVSLNGVEKSLQSFMFTIDKEVDVIAVNPPIGVQSGTNVIVIGKSFIRSANLTCLFGDIETSQAFYISSNEIACQSPSLDDNIQSPIDASVRVSLNGQDYSSAAADFRISPTASVDSIIPNKGPVDGGTQVVVKGSNFFSNDFSAPLCRFGNVSVPALALTTRDLTCVSPSFSTNEEVLFTVSMNGGVNWVELGHVSFLYLPIIKTVFIEPSSGPFTGGTLVTVDGVDFDQSSTVACRFGDVVSTEVVFLSDQRVQCKSPSHPPGFVSFAVTSEDTEASSELSFEFYMPPQIMSAFPINGPRRGGTVVKVYGKHFRSNVKYECRFGDDAVPAEYTTMDSIECVSPRNPDNATGVITTVTVAERASNFTGGSLNFTYTPLPSLGYTLPQFVTDEGDSTSVFGEYFDATDAWCRFSFLPSLQLGSNVVHASVVSKERVDCRVPPHPLPGYQTEAFVEVSMNGYDWSDSRLSFMYLPKPSISSIQPTLGSVNGGTRVGIIGSNFIEGSDLWCNFDSAGSVPAIWESASSILCITPPITAPMNVSVSVHWKGSNSGIKEGDAHFFSYLRDLTLEEASPMRGFVNGGTIVTVVGTGFIDVPSLICHFGSVRVIARYMNSNTIECTSPPVRQPHHVELSVSLNGMDESPFFVRSTFTYDFELNIFGVVPSNVAVQVEDSSDNDIPRFVSVLGSSFVNTTDLSCRFGQHWVMNAVFVSDAKVLCQLPKTLEAGKVHVGVSLNGIDFSNKSASVTLVPPAIVYSMTPARVQEGHEVMIAVKGENFIPSSDLQCKFGRYSHSWTPALWRNETLVECKTPSFNLTADAYELVGVSNNGGYDISALVALEVTARARFLSMYPDVGYVDGGTQVSILLSNFRESANLSCRFGEVSTPATSIRSIIACQSPPRSRGDVVVLLLHNGMQIASGTFEYIEPPRISALEPISGWLEGGSVVTIQGTGFVGVTHCRFGDRIVQATVESDHGMSCVSPPSDVATGVLVQVTHNEQNYAPSRIMFDYQATPKVFSLMPSYGAGFGGKPIYVSGDNFIATPMLQCRFGKYTVEAILISTSMISCISPPLIPGETSFGVSLNGIDFVGDATIKYRAIALPQISTMHPRVGRLSGNETVIVNTTELPMTERIACHFGHRIVSATYLSPNSLACVTPFAEVSGGVNVSVSVDGERYGSNDDSSMEFTYVTVPEITSVSPNFGWTIGGAQVSLSVEHLEPFLSSKFSCSFGGLGLFTAATQVLNDRVVCTAPEFNESQMNYHAPITLSIDNGISYTRMESPVYSYLPPALITKIDPPVGTVNGGTPVRVLGIDLRNMFGLQCYFGNATTDAEFVGGGEIQCVSPEYDGGAKQRNIRIGLQNGIMLSEESHAVFEYLPHPIIKGMHPRFGSVNGGASVTIQLVKAWPEAIKYLACRFGNSTLVSPVSTNDNGDITCLSPPVHEVIGHRGRREQDVTVSLYAVHGQSHLVSSETPFVYANHIEIQSLTPSSGSFIGGTNISVVAKGLHPSIPNEQLTCHFDNEAVVPATLVKNVDDGHYHLQCLSPPIESSSPTKSVLVTLGIDGLRDVATLGRRFTYFKAPSVSSLQPSFGFWEGGETILVRGNHFRNNLDLGCMFGDFESPKVGWVSSTEIFCTSPLPKNGVLSTSSVNVRVTNNGVDFTDAEITYSYIHRPHVSMVHPASVDWDESSILTITGTHLQLVTGCRFGEVKDVYPAFNLTSNNIKCKIPPASALTQSKVAIFLELGNGFVSTGLAVQYIRMPPKVISDVTEPQLTSVVPNYGSSSGGDWLRVQGSGFLSRNELQCRFGEYHVAQEVHFVSSSEIRCMTPRHIPSKSTLAVTNGGEVLEGRRGELEYTFVSDVSIISVSPSFGSMKGGTAVSLFGSFPVQSGLDIDIKCKFGTNGVVSGEVITQNQVKCASPPANLPDMVEVTLSIDGGDNFNRAGWYAYKMNIHIEELIPNYGYVSGGSPISVIGRHFPNSTGLQCMFGYYNVSATFISSETISCIHPPHQVGMDKRVSVKVFVEGDLVASSWKFFDYMDPPRITSFDPMFGDSTLGGSEVTVRGSGFRNVLQLMCSFGQHVSVRAKVIDATTMICPIPCHPPGVVDFFVADAYAQYSVESDAGSSQFHFIPESSINNVLPTWGSTGVSSVLSYITGTNFDTLGMTHDIDIVMSDSFGLTRHNGFDHIEHGMFVHPRDLLSPNGTILLPSLGHNVTLCEPGTFQPQSSNTECLICPVGFICPRFGMAKPQVCPAGSICSRLGLVTPSSQCIAGHYCPSGTKMSTQMTQYGKNIWVLEEETGVLTAATTDGDWNYIDRNSPATGTRRILHPPVDANVTALQPFPCALGYYCRPGVSTNYEYRMGDFTTPQLCHEGHFCPRGSQSPEGSGPCPTGYFCESVDTAEPCPSGSYCPGTGNTNPLPCFPGSYSPVTGLSNCILCETGNQCPGWGRVSPEPCRAGFVCDEVGLAVPERPCPGGYYCEEGTSVEDPNSLVGKGPLPCEPGLFCLFGVAHQKASLMAGLPSVDLALPQPCAEGYYCASNSSTPMGSGRCFPGHYCPPNAPFPTQVPPGSFAGDDGGAIVPSLCLPGTFSPRPGSVSCSPCPAGFACLGYGTFVPRICDPGTYRSTADSIPCKLCPQRTYSSHSGLMDISQCLPCPEGRVCGTQGMPDLQLSDVCPDGHVCGYVTDRFAQYDHKCPGGVYCGNETTTSKQYSNHCLSGTYCERGTTHALRAKNKCSKSHFCAVGTSKPEPFTTRCPKQTTSVIGAKDMESCVISKVAIYDKISFRPDNPFDAVSYYPVDNVTVNEEDNGGVEVMVVEKILPFNANSSNVMPWKNDTVEVFRPCPAYGFAAQNQAAITVIGRNFRNSTNLTCRFRICHGLKRESDKGVDLVMPGFCDAVAVNLSNAILAAGTFINETRVSCSVPAFDAGVDFTPLNSPDVDSSPTQLCLRDDGGALYLSQKCSDAEVRSGVCAFERSLPAYGLRRRVYSLFVSCSRGDVVNGACGNDSSKLNPCLTQQLIVDVSNNGKKFSGDGSIVPYTSALSDSSASNNARVIPPTFAIYDVVLEDGAPMTEKNTFQSSTDFDSEFCQRPSSHEEERRMVEDGWFLSPYMSRFHLSFDWRHLPTYLVYDKHYTLAVYVVPSRCKGSGTNYHDVENIPCLQPMELPIWFTNGAIDKNQMMNLTLTSLDDSMFRVEVQIINGLALPLADFFERTMSVVLDHPQRARTLGQELSDAVSAYEIGSITTKSKDFWSNPHPSALEAKKQNDLHFETFHGVSLDLSGQSYKYEHDSLLLPYLPYFSNCREFDSYIPLWSLVESPDRCGLPGVTRDHPTYWWRRQIPSLPHPDDVKAIGPFDFMSFYPVSDWCERKLYCNFEENLSEPDVTPRWFEADSGATLFSIIRDPIDYYDYTGRRASMVGSHDGGGQRFINSIDTLQTFIPAKVDRSPALNVEGGCTTACFPRRVTLDISYQQVDVHSKRIVQVKVLYDRFDKDASNDGYELQIKFYALDFQELVIKFAFSRELFLLLFAQIGVGTVLVALVYWIVVRLSTRLESPPKLRITGFLWLTFPPALGGFLLGLVPISIVTSVVYYLMKGYNHFTPETDPEGRNWLFLTSARLHFTDVNIDPDYLHSTRQGRTGMAFITMSVASICFTSKMLVPKRMPRGNKASILPEDRTSEKSMIWKRSNLVYSSILMSLFLVVIVEWSFWGSFGTYIWEEIIFLKVLSIFVGSVVDGQLGEALLSAPVMTAMGLVQGIVTMSANDFMDFLLSYIVGFGFLIIERMYIGPLQADFASWIFKICSATFKRVKATATAGVPIDEETTSMTPEKNNETLEPLLGSFASYSCDTLSLLYSPFIMVIIMLFRDEAEITKLYGIKEADMEYYVLFALAIIPFQIVADIFLHNALELLHGWKIYEYLEYCSVRFAQREVWWKGFESNTLDDCIQESLRSVDQMCFSSQYYMLNTIHVNAMIYFVLGVEMMTRANYNLFGDPAMFPIVAIVFLSVMVVKGALVWFGRILGVWRIRYEKRGWHDHVQLEGDPNVEQLGEIQGSGHDRYQMELRMSSETFRYKFLRYNRSWIINQLPDMLTPRVTQRSRPYMINQLSRVLGAINQDITSDSDSDGGPDFEVGLVNASSRTMLRKWLKQAERLLRLKKIIQPLIQQAKGSECDVCLSRNQLSVETFFSVEELDERFITEYGDSVTDDLDQVLWKKFFKRNQRYQTICLPCAKERNTKRQEDVINDDRSEDEGHDRDILMYTLNPISESIMATWYEKARANIR